MSSAFRLLIFDLDGTLVDSFPGLRLGLNRALAELGAPARDLAWVRRHVGRGAGRLIAAAAGSELDPERLMTCFRHHYGEVLTEHTPPYEGVDGTLRLLAREYLLAVASNKPLQWVEALIRHLGWWELMAMVVGPESTGQHKPNPGMIEEILTRVRCAPAEALLVGDMPVDAETGANADIPVLGVATGSASRAELLAAGCIHVLDGVPQLPAWLAGRADGGE